MNVVYYLLLFALAVYALILILFVRDEGSPRPGTQGKPPTETQRRKLAVQTLFGTPRTTALVWTGSMYLTLLTMHCVDAGRWVGFVMVAYLAIGLATVLRLNPDKHASWACLPWSARVVFVLGHAWLWPLHWLHRRALADRVSTDQRREETHD